MSVSNDRQAQMGRFAEMYRARHFDPAGFDLDAGYLQTTLSDDARMPLRFFVEYNNVWWFEIVTAVEDRGLRSVQQVRLHHPRHLLRR